MAVARSASAPYTKKQQAVKTISTDRDIKPGTLIKDVVQPSDVLAIPIVSRTKETFKYVNVNQRELTLYC